MGKENKHSFDSLEPENNEEQLLKKFPGPSNGKKFVKFIFALLVVILGTVVSFKILTNIATKNKKTIAQKKQPLLSNKEAGKILTKLLKNQDFRDRNWVYFFLNNLEKKALDKGLSKSFIKYLKKSYLLLDSPGRWLALCQNIDKKWFNYQPPNEKELRIKEEESIPDGSILYFSKYSEIWKEKWIAPFCAESLFLSGNWQNFLYIDNALLNSLYSKTNPPKKWVLYRITSYNKTNKAEESTSICQKNWLSVKSNAKMLHACSQAFLKTDNYTAAKKSLQYAYNLTREKKYLIEYSKILLLQGKKEKAAKILLSIPD